jgi:hypothetical protein
MEDRGFRRRLYKESQAGDDCRGASIKKDSSSETVAENVYKEGTAKTLSEASINKGLGTVKYLDRLSQKGLTVEFVQ